MGGGHNRNLKNCTKIVKIILKCTPEIYMIIIRNKTNIEILGIVIINYTNENIDQITLKAETF